MTIPNKRKLDVFAHHAAIRDNSAISVNVVLPALDRRSADEIIESHRSLLSASIWLARGVETRLSFLRRVNAMKPDALAMYLYCVAADDRSATNYVAEGNA